MEQVTKEFLAAALNGHEYGDGKVVSELLEAAAKANGLVVIYGESDDLMEFRGAFDEEIGANNGTTALIDAEGLVVRPDHYDERDDAELERYLQRKRTAATIEALWGENHSSWSYKSNLPHASFDIKEDGDVYCRGIVIAVSDLPKVLDWQKIAAGRLEKIKDMSGYLDHLADGLGVAKPSTPIEGVGAVWKVIDAIANLQTQNKRLRTVVDEADQYLDTNSLTNIGNGSKLHQAFKHALEITPDQGGDAATGTCTWTQPTDSDLGDSDCYQAECDGSTVTYRDDDMERCYRCGKKIAFDA